MAIARKTVVKGRSEQYSREVFTNVGGHIDAELTLRQDGDILLVGSQGIYRRSNCKLYLLRHGEQFLQVIIEFLLTPYF